LIPLVDWVLSHYNLPMKNPFSEKEIPYGTFALTGYRKWLLSLAQGLNRSWLNKRIGLVLRKMVLQNRLQIVDEEVLGIKSRFYPLQNLGDRYLLFLPNFYEHREFEFLSHILKPQDVFLDIGANVGIYSLWAAKFIVAPRQILALEPNPITYSRLQYNISFNNCQEKIVPIHAGVADQETTFELFVDPTNLGGATITEQPPSYHPVSIHCRPLFSILQEHKIERVDVMKIDIEGAEALALNAFYKEAPRSLYPRIVLIESPQNIDFEGLGYTFLQRTRSHNTILRLDK
jgi:FkbM family methyltransferase